ncbi:hypothetical protein NTH31_003977 [Vibrio mimicus]
MALNVCLLDAFA